MPSFSLFLGAVRVLVVLVFSILGFQRYEPDLAVDFGTALLRTGLADGRLCTRAPSRCGARTALKQGVVADTDAAVTVLDRVFAQHRKNTRVNVLACAPSDATEQEQAALVYALKTAGARQAVLVPEPVAALIGAGVDIGSGGAFLVIDLGEGVVDCALIKERKLFASATWRGGCAAIREAFASKLRETGLQIRGFEAEWLLRRVGLAGREDELFPVHGTAPGGRAMVTLVPAGVLHAALREEMDRITATVLGFLRQLDPQLCSEAIANGVQITGGGALIPGLVEYGARATHLPIQRAPQPLESVIHGACLLLGPTVKLDLWDSLRTFWPAGSPHL